MAGFFKFMDCLLNTKIEELEKVFSGKVRDVYKVDDETLLLVATDRISAFDVILPNGIPERGKILTSISNKWFSMFDFPNHVISKEPFSVLPFLKRYKELFKRAVLVKRAKKIEAECIVRGYLFGTAYKDYVRDGSVCGIKLEKGLKLAQKLPTPIFTPSTKAKSGHDENIDFEKFSKIVGGEELAKLIADTSLKIYERAHHLLLDKGIILADTKFEFGFSKDGELILIDEILTPDSSRFWEKNEYKVGTSPKSFDKQIVRDYLEENWDKKSPPPILPPHVVEKTKLRYEIIEKIILSI